jgi:hypothetical protein
MKIYFSCWGEENKDIKSFTDQRKKTKELLVGKFKKQKNSKNYKYEIEGCLN